MGTLIYPVNVYLLISLNLCVYSDHIILLIIVMILVPDSSLEFISLFYASPHLPHG